MVPPDPYDLWLQQHMAELAQYPDCFVAIDPFEGKQGVVLHSRDEADFNRQLRERYERDPSARERLLVAHTSLYL
jgi:hypothetical protein